MKNRLTNGICFIVAIFMLTACNDYAVYHSYRYIPKQGWNRNDTLIFDVQLTDTLKSHYLYAQIRNTNVYPYQNLSLVIIHNLQDSSVWVTDTIRCKLADTEGRWKGDGWGVLFQLSCPVDTFFAEQSGAHIVKVIHHMKDETITGINDIGVRIERAE